MNKILIDAQEALDALTYIDTKALLNNKEIRKVVIGKIQPIRRAMRQDFRSKLKGTPKDPRNMARAIGGVIYRRTIGGTVSILNSRKKESKYYVMERGGKSGKPRNRTASPNTIRQQEAWGRDRAFILRWINEGTTGQPHPARGFFDRAESLARRASFELAEEIVAMIEEIHKKHTT
jgi:hypothetical protein